jgi:hypothetical protein
LIKDLEVVRENIALANQLINKKNHPMARELLERVEKMET